MSKYNPLWEHIKATHELLYQISFEEIKAILGFEIDHSILTFKKELTQYGYQVDKISLKEHWVKFSKL